MAVTAALSVVSSDASVACLWNCDSYSLGEIYSSVSCLRYHVHFKPPSASRLNQVGRFFAEITTKRIRRGAFRSVRHLEQAIADYLFEYNANPKPFSMDRHRGPDTQSSQKSLSTNR